MDLRLAKILNFSAYGFDICSLDIDSLYDFNWERKSFYYFWGWRSMDFAGHTPSAYSSQLMSNRPN